MQLAFPKFLSGEKKLSRRCTCTRDVFSTKSNKFPPSKPPAGARAKRPSTFPMASMKRLMINAACLVQYLVLAPVISGQNYGYCCLAASHGTTLPSATSNGILESTHHLPFRRSAVLTQRTIRWKTLPCTERASTGLRQSWLEANGQGRNLVGQHTRGYRNNRQLRNPVTRSCNIRMLLISTVSTSPITLECTGTTTCNVPIYLIYSSSSATVDSFITAFSWPTAFTSRHICAAV